MVNLHQEDNTDMGKRYQFIVSVVLICMLLFCCGRNDTGNLPENSYHPGTDMQFFYMSGGINVTHMGLSH